MAGNDPGLLFTLQLRISVPRAKTPFSLGPNILQASRPLPPPQPSPTPPPPMPSASPTPTITPVTTDTLLQLTIPPGSPSDADRLLDLMNASAMAITDPAYTRCWICFSPAPPFYEGVAVLGSPRPISDPNALPWALEDDHAITIGQILGSGLCLRPNHTRLPSQLSSTCNRTTILYPGSPAPFLLAPNGTYFACSSGLSPHIVIDSFVEHNDYCILILLLPRLTVHHTEDLLLHRAFGHPRSKREPITAITVGILLALGASGAGTGIASLVETRDQFRHLSTLQRKVDSDIAELKQGLKHLTNTVNSLAEMVLQNRRGLNLAFLKEGGVCAALKEERCVFKDETGLVRDSIKRIEDSLEERRREIDQSESWYRNWFSTTPWLSTLLPAFLGPFIGLLLLISFGPWAFRRLTSFVKNQVDEATKKYPSVLYQRLNASEDPSPSATESDVKDVSPPMSFEVFERLANRPLSVRSRFAKLWRRLKC